VQLPPTLLLLALPACSPAGGHGDSTDTGDREPTHVPGPDCTEEPWPLVHPWNVLADHLMAGVLDEGMEADIQTLVDVIGSGALPGPWQHAVHGPWQSLDGVAWDGQDGTVLDHASVPDLVIDEDGLSWLFFNDTNPEALLEAARSGLPQSTGIPTGGIFAARSENGRDFERVGIEMHGQRPLLMVDPDIRRLPDGRYRLFFVGVLPENVCADVLDPDRAPVPHEVWTAVSDDLVAWDGEGVAFSSPRGGRDPATWCRDETCWLTLRSTAISTDGGATFTETEITLPVDDPQVPDVAPVPGGWWMIWRTRDDVLLRTASSSDGSHFTPDGQTQIAGDSPAVWEQDGGAVLYVSRDAAGAAR